MARRADTRGRNESHAWGNAEIRAVGGDGTRSAAMLPLEGTVLEKLRKIEALHAGTKIDGEREAARRAAERIRARLAELRGREGAVRFVTT